MLKFIIAFIFIVTGLYADYSERFTSSIQEAFPKNVLIIEKQLILDKKTFLILQNLIQDSIPDSFIIYTALLDNEIIGYAVFDHKAINYHPITFLSRLDEDGVFMNLRVLDNQDYIGKESWSPHLLNQFIGKSILDELQLEDVDVITGATLSSRTAVLVVRRALFVIDYYINNYIKKD
jgi:Na+-translocating ferredoxin:NAD+ oxidoreductase RnfG subunit